MGAGHHSLLFKSCVPRLLDLSVGKYQVWLPSRLPPTDHGRFPGSLATNAAIMASVVLASRLSSIIHVFSLVLVSMEWFALFPIFRRYLRTNFPTIHMALTFLLVAGACLSTGLIVSPGMALALFCSLVVAIFLCPYWLISLQKYKKYAGVLGLSNHTQ